MGEKAIHKSRGGGGPSHRFDDYDIHFRPIRLTPEQAQRNILKGDFDESHTVPLTVDLDVNYYDNDCLYASFMRDGIVPFKGAGGSRLAVSVRQSAKVNLFGLGSHENYNSMSISLAPCGNSSESCQSVGNERAFYEVLGELSNLKPGVFISAVLYGDYNADRKTDILVRLSDGGAFVFEQTQTPLKVSLPHLPPPPRL